jgi:hypothetical protein
MSLRQATTVRPKPTSSIPNHSDHQNIVKKSSLLSLPFGSWSPN